MSLPRRLLVFVAILAIAAGLYIGWLTFVPASAAIVVQLDTTYQTIEGFGTGHSDDDPTLITDSFADLLWDRDKGIGLSILRMMIDPDGQPHRDEGDYAKTGGWDLWGHVHKALLRNPGLRVLATPLSPPAVWKDNKNTRGGGSLCARTGQGSCDGSHYSDWASAITAFVTLAAAQKPPIYLYAIGVQNEPDFVAPYYSCVYSPEQMRDFVKILGPGLSRLQPKPRLMAPETANWSNLASYIAAIERDTEASRYVDLHGVHQYGHATALAPSSSAHALWQTEMSGLQGGPEPRWDPSIKNGIAVAKWIHSALVDGNVTAWLWWRALNEWGAGSPPKAGDNQDLIIDVNGTLTSKATITKRLYTLGNFSKFVRPGSVRVGIEGEIPASVFVSAYKGEGDNVIVVVINDKMFATQLSVSISGGHPPSMVVPWITSASDNLMAKEPVAVLAGTFTYQLPSRSVITFASESKAPITERR